MAEIQYSYYRILHLLDGTPDAAYKPQLAHLFNQLGVDPYSIQDTSPYAQRVGSEQASPNPEDKQGQGFVSGNKINTGGIGGQVTDESDMNEDQIGAPLKEVITGTIGATLLTHLANLRATLNKLITVYDDRLDADAISDEATTSTDNLKNMDKILSEQQALVEQTVSALASENAELYTAQQANQQSPLRTKIKALVETDGLFRKEIHAIKDDVAVIGKLLRDNSPEHHTIAQEVENDVSKSPFAIPTLKPY